MSSEQWFTSTSTLNQNYSKCGPWTRASVLTVCYRSLPRQVQKSKDKHLVTSVAISHLQHQGLLWMKRFGDPLTHTASHGVNCVLVTQEVRHWSATSEKFEMKWKPWSCTKSTLRSTALNHENHVFKCRCYYLLFSYGEPNGSGGPLKTWFVTHSSKRRGHNMPCRATEGSNRVSREAEGVGGQCGQEPLLWFPWKGTGEAG